MDQKRKVMAQDSADKQRIHRYRRASLFLLVFAGISLLLAAIIPFTLPAQLDDPDIPRAWVVYACLFSTALDLIVAGVFTLKSTAIKKRLRREARERGEDSNPIR